jgi:hypothetical protein
MLSEFWWDAYLWNIDGIVVWPVWLALLCIAVVLTVQMSRDSEKRKRNTTLIAACFLGSLLMPFTGEFSGDLAFRQACAKDVGLTIYKKIPIGEGLLIPMENVKNKKFKNSPFEFETYGLMVDEDVFRKNYSYSREVINVNEVKGFNYTISNIKTGQIYSKFINYYGYKGFSEGARKCHHLASSREEKEELRRQLSIDQSLQIIETIDLVISKKEREL